MTIMSKFSLQKFGAPVSAEAFNARIKTFDDTFVSYSLRSGGHQTIAAKHRKLTAHKFLEHKTLADADLSSKSF